MRQGIFLTVVAILISGCVTTMKGAYVPTQDMNVKWLGLNADKVGTGKVTGDGDLDGHFQVELELSANETVESIGVFQTNSSGVGSLGHGVWHTKPGLTWVVGVFKDGKPLNTQHTDSIGQFSGRSTFDIYISENKWVGHMQNGHHFVLEVVHGGKSSKELITLQQNASTSRPLTKVMSKAEDAAAKQAETERQAEFKQLEESYAAAMKSGAQFEGSSDFREAAKHYQKAVSLATKFSDQAKENAAREKAISTVRSLSVPPAVPEEARRFGIRGEAIMNTAKRPSDFKRAVAEFKAAANLAPWWGSAYYNLGLAREASKDAKGAIAAFNLFLKAEPDAPEAQAIKDRLYALEIPAEEQARKSAYAGTWKSQSGSILKLEYQEDHFIFTEVKPSKAAMEVGYHVGQKIFDGLWDGTQIVGKSLVAHTGGEANPRFSACFGKFGEYSATVKLSTSEGLILQYNDQWVTRFNTDTCEALERGSITSTNKFVR